MQDEIQQRGQKKFRESLHGTAHYLYHTKRQECRKKAIPFDLTKEWYRGQLEKGCAVTDLPFRLTAQGKPNPYSPSVDRIDPSKGYLKNNCRLVLYGVNSLKGTGTDDDMWQIATKIFLAYSIQKWIR